MSRQVSIKAYCDGGHDDLVPATVERTLRLDGGKSRLVDLCADCDRRFILPVVALMGNGADVDHPVLDRPRKGVGGRRKRGDALPTTCPDCGYECPTRSALGQHVKLRHDKALSNYAWDT